jgi:hypothetical protein
MASPMKTDLDGLLFSQRAEALERNGVIDCWNDKFERKMRNRDSHHAIHCDFCAQLLVKLLHA